MNNRLQMTVTLQVTPAQALTLQTMFNHWNYLSNIGSSRKSSFFVDGDGSFHPKCEMSFSEPIPEMTDKIKYAAMEVNQNGNTIFDFDNVATLLNNTDAKTIY